MEDLLAFLTVQRRGFEGIAESPATAEEAERFRGKLGTRGRSWPG